MTNTRRNMLSSHSIVNHRGSGKMLKSLSPSSSTTGLAIRLHIIALAFIASYAFMSTTFWTDNHPNISNDSIRHQLLPVEERSHDHRYLQPFLKYTHQSTSSASLSNRRLLFEDNVVRTSGTNDDPSNKNCRNYLKQFLSGTTIDRDECEGLENAYTSSKCQQNENGNDKPTLLFNQQNNNTDNDSNNNNRDNNDNNKNDDFFEEFECCKVISHYYSSKCMYHQRYASLSLLGIVSVLILCSLTKTILHSCTLISLQWLPEAGGCIIVGAIVSLILNSFFTGKNTTTLFDYNSFNDELFMYILLPPIIFQASLSIHKKQFTKLLYPILMFAVFGTFLSSILIGYIVHYGTYYIPDNITTTIPLLDSMLYGSLISSIDPVATLSILGSMGIATDHVLYVVVFGESILNDGVAIALFDSLKMHLEKRNDENLGGNINYLKSDDIDNQLVKESIQYFIKICIGSVSVGLLVGILCTMYFWFLRGKQSPVMEVGTFFCFAFIAYYSSDGLLRCSGIVSIMTAGFIMDIYVRGYRLSDQDEEHEIGQNNSNSNVRGVAEGVSHYPNQDGNVDHLYASLSSSEMTTRARCCWDNNFSIRGLLTDCKIMFSGVGHMSHRARVHVGFVADVLANLMETSIFAYLGLFLFSNKKWDDIPLIIIGISSCVLSRILMIGITSVIVNGGIMLKNYVQSFFRKMFNRVSNNDDEPIDSQQQNRFNHNHDQEAFYIDRNMQLVLLYSGVRGAVSLALAENIPLYDAVTNSGSMFKPALKAMTSSSIMFTVFFFGASTYFTLKRQRERINQVGLDTEAQRRVGMIRGNVNFNIFGHDQQVQHDLSLQEEDTGSTLTTSLLSSDAVASNEERHLPPWMRS